MSFQEEKRESIKRYMLDKIRQDDEAFVSKTMENFEISITTVKRYLKECLENHILCENKACRTGFELAVEKAEYVYKYDDYLDESNIYYKDIRVHLADVSDEAKSIWSYTFTEMMNNAIEHSRCKNIHCTIKKDYLYTEISITDDGIGIFANVRRYLKEQLQRPVDINDVITELYKGKLTTNPEEHSGEGIFFTSKVLNTFAIWSDNTIFWQGYGERYRFVESHLVAYHNRLNNIGTMVVMRLENQTKRTTKEVFDLYAPVEEGFVRTRIPLAEVCPFAEPVARSQARRILYRLEQFKRIEFDFTGIDFMGQGFADEIFRVFQNKYPEIELLPIHANASVLGMIRHVQR